MAIKLRSIYNSTTLGIIHSDERNIAMHNTLTQSDFVSPYPETGEYVHAAALLPLLHKHLRNVPHSVHMTGSYATPPFLTEHWDNIGALQPYDVGITLYALICYRLPVAEAITQALAEHYHLSSETKADMHLCLHEAITNAVVHGNLSVHGTVGSKEDLRSFYETIETKLAIPALRYSSVHIALTEQDSQVQMDIIDEGRGYQYGEFFSDIGSIPLHKGLILIQKSCIATQILGNGNHIRMTFKLP